MMSSNQPDFSRMSAQDLKGYLIAHRNDEQAWAEFVSRHKSNGGRKFSPPADLEEGKRLVEQTLREHFGLPPQPDV